MINFHYFYLLIALVVFKDAMGKNTSVINQQKVEAKYKYKENDSFTIPLKVSQSQTLLMPIRGLLPEQYRKISQPLITKISEIKNDHTHRNSQSVCNVIRAPVHKPFKIRHKLNHKIRNQSQWIKLAINRQVIYKLEDLSKLEYALDMEIIDDKIVLIFEDGQIIFYQLASENLKQIARKSIFSLEQTNNKKVLKQGKLLSMGQFGIYISSSELIFINGKDFSIQISKDYQYTPYFYTAILSKRGKQTTLIVGSGKKGMKHYLVDFQNRKISKIGQHKITFEEEHLPGQLFKVSVVDLIEVTQLFNSSNTSTYLILDPNHGILKFQIAQGQALNLTKAARTSVKYKNCRLMKLHSSEIYTSCPQVIRYNPATNQVDVKAILTQLPLEIISTPLHLTLISHTSFQIFDHCSGAIEEGSMDGHSFQHTIPYRGFYISIDDISIVLWTIKYPEYFIACKGNKMFKGNNKFDLYVSSTCDNNEQCCIETFKAQLQIYDSQDGFHLFQVIGALFIACVSLILAFWILLKKRGLRKQYNQLMQEPQFKNQATQNTQQSMHETGGSKKTDNVEHVQIVQ